MASEAGKQLNGLSRIASSFDKDTNRWAVLLPDGHNKKIKCENLKTPGGIWRTNAFSFNTGGTEAVFESFFRIADRQHDDEVAWILQIGPHGNDKR